MKKKSPAFSMLLTEVEREVSKHLSANQIVSVFGVQAFRNEISALEKALINEVGLIHEQLQKSCTEFLCALHETTTKITDRNAFYQVILPFVRLFREEVEMLSMWKK